MAFNIWERWPWTSFQNLNLDWLMKAVKEAVTKAEEASESVGQFDARITANENAIEQLGIDLETISSPLRVYVNSDLEAFYLGHHITGVELKAMLQTHGDLPYVEFNGEVYMLDTASNAGDLRFSMGHTSGPLDDDLVIRHIMIPAQSYNCAYSISNIGSGGGSSGNVFAVVVRSQSGGYVADHSYAEILSQMQNGRIPVLLVSQGNTHYSVCGMAGTDSRTINGQSVPCIRFAAPGWLYSSSNNVGVWTIDANGVEYMASLKQMATLDNIIQFVNDGVTTNALLKTAQTLSAAEQAQVKQNLGISDGGGSSDFVLLRMDTNGQVYNGTATAITGTQINTLAATNKALFLWDEDNERLYTYTEQGTSAGQLDGTAEFVSPLSNGNGCYLVVVNAANNNSTFYSQSAVPTVTASDNGKFLRVVSGAWAAQTVPSAESNSFGGA